MGPALECRLQQCSLDCHCAAMASTLQDENEALKRRIAELEAQLEAASAKKSMDVPTHSTSPFPDFFHAEEAPLSKAEVERYGRQLIMKEIGAKGPFVGRMAAQKIWVAILRPFLHSRC